MNPRNDPNESEKILNNVKNEFNGILLSGILSTSNSPILRDLILHVNPNATRENISVMLKKIQDMRIKIKSNNKIINVKEKLSGATSVAPFNPELSKKSSLQAVSLFSGIEFVVDTPKKASELEKKLLHIHDQLSTIYQRMELPPLHYSYTEKDLSNSQSVRTFIDDDVNKGINPEKKTASIVDFERDTKLGGFVTEKNPALLVAAKIIRFVNPDEHDLPQPLENIINDEIERNKLIKEKEELEQIELARLMGKDEKPVEIPEEEKESSLDQEPEAKEEMDIDEYIKRAKEGWVSKPFETENIIVEAPKPSDTQVKINELEAKIKALDKRISINLKALDYLNVQHPDYQEMEVKLEKLYDKYPTAQFIRAYGGQIMQYINIVESRAVLSSDEMIVTPELNMSAVKWTREKDGSMQCKTDFDLRTVFINGDRYKMSQSGFLLESDDKVKKEKVPTLYSSEAKFLLTEKDKKPQLSILEFKYVLNSRELVPTQFQEPKLTPKKE